MNLRACSAGVIVAAAVDHNWSGRSGSCANPSALATHGKGAFRTRRRWLPQGTKREKSGRSDDSRSQSRGCESLDREPRCSLSTTIRASGSRRSSRLLRSRTRTRQPSARTLPGPSRVDAAQTNHRSARTSRSPGTRRGSISSPSGQCRPVSPTSREQGRAQRRSTPRADMASSRPGTFAPTQCPS